MGYIASKKNENSIGQIRFDLSDQFIEIIEDTYRVIDNERNGFLIIQIQVFTENIINILAGKQILIDTGHYFNSLFSSGHKLFEKTLYYYIYDDIGITCHLHDGISDHILSTAA